MRLKIDREALAKLRRLSDDEMAVVHRVLRTPEIELRPADVAAVEAIFVSENIPFRTEAELRAHEQSPAVERYEKVLDGRDVRDLSDQDFRKAESILLSGIPGASRRP